MSRLRPLIAGTLIAAAGLIGVNGIAYAATGSNVILGHSNYANKATKITRTTTGPAVVLRVKSNQVPFTVNSTKQVAKLNASYVGGLTAGSLQTRAIEYTIPSSTVLSFGTYSLAGLPVGTYDASFRLVGHMSASGASLNCLLEQTDGTHLILAYGAPYNVYSATSASGVVTVTAAHPLALYCFSSAGTYALVPSDRSIVDFVKIDGVTVHAAPTPAIAHTRSAAHGSATSR